jgi:hypothetical protein
MYIINKLVLFLFMAHCNICIGVWVFLDCSYMFLPIITLHNWEYAVGNWYRVPFLLIYSYCRGSARNVCGVCLLQCGILCRRADVCGSVMIKITFMCKKNTIWCYYVRAVKLAICFELHTVLLFLVIFKLVYLLAILLRTAHKCGWSYLIFR